MADEAVAENRLREEAEETQEEVVAEENRQAINELLANATLRDRPEALREVTRGVITNEGASSIGRELGETTDPITDELSSRSTDTSSDTLRASPLGLVSRFAFRLVHNLWSNESETTVFELAINQLLKAWYTNLVSYRV